MREETTCPRHTPWGGVQQQKQLFPGCWTVSTAGHGGFYVTRAVFEQMPEALREKTCAGPQWFEEDCDWALVVVAFPQYFTPYEVYNAVRSVMEWNKEAWTVYGQTEAGKLLLDRANRFEQDNGHKFSFGSMGTGGKGWACSAYSLDRQTRVHFNCEDPWLLKSPFTLEEIQAIAEPGTFKSEPLPQKAPETFSELLPAGMAKA